MVVFVFIILIALGIIVSKAWKSDSVRPISTNKFQPRTESLDLSFDYAENPEQAVGKYLIVDLETTGLPKKRYGSPEEIDNWPLVVQIAWMLFDENQKLIKFQNFFIKQKKKIPKDAIAIHGITDEKVNQEGKEPKEVFELLSKAISKSQCFVSHNVSFDLPIVEAEIIRNGLPKQLESKMTLCTMELSKKFCAIHSYHGSGYKNPTLTELVKQCFYANEISVKLVENHKADLDVRIVAKCFYKLLELNVIKPSMQKRFAYVKENIGSRDWTVSNGNVSIGVSEGRLYNKGDISTSQIIKKQIDIVLNADLTTNEQIQKIKELQEPYKNDPEIINGLNKHSYWHSLHIIMNNPLMPIELSKKARSERVRMMTAFNRKQITEFPLFEVKNYCLESKLKLSSNDRVAYENFEFINHSRDFDIVK